jgi:hypothetical protein
MSKVINLIKSENLLNHLPLEIEDIICDYLKPNKFKVGSYYKSYDGIGLYKIIKRTDKFVSVVYVISKSGEHLYSSKKKIRVDENENEFINIHNSPLSIIWSYNIYD